MSKTCGCQRKGKIPSWCYISIVWQYRNLTKPCWDCHSKSINQSSKDIPEQQFPFFLAQFLQCMQLKWNIGQRRNESIIIQETKKKTFGNLASHGITFPSIIILLNARWICHNDGHAFVLWTTPDKQTEIYWSVYWLWVHSKQLIPD